jgi:hypothetical protein
MKLNYPCLAICLILGTLPLVGAQKKGSPSREADKDCTWTKMTDERIGLDAWVEQCDYGFRKIDFAFVGNSLAVRFSDGDGKPDPLVDVLPLRADETPEAGIERVFAANTDKAVAARCELAPFKGEPKAPLGTKRYSFVPNKQYQAEIDKTSSPDEIGDPACGDFGDMPDGIQYFEVQPDNGSRKVLFVRIGQDTPLFDEQTLKLLPKM